MHTHLFQFLETQFFWAKALAVTGELLWFVALALLIRDSARDKTNSMPLAAICFNVAYEVYYAFICPYLHPEICIDDHGFQMWTWRGWLVLNLVLAYYLLRYGREQPQELPIVKRHYYSWIGIFFLLGLAGQITFVPFYDDVNGNEGTTIANLVMSVLYIFLLYARPDLRGLSLGVAWTKMLGSGLINLSMVVADPFPNPGYDSDSFMYYLFIAIFVFDAGYLWLLHRRRRELLAADPSAAAGSC